MNKTVMSIAGLDPSAGSGLFADMKMLQAIRLYGVGVATAVMAQNSQGVSGLHPVPYEMVAQQLDDLFNDMEIHAVKTGVLGTAKNIELVAALLQAFKVPYLVVDPVLKSYSGFEFLDAKGIEAYKTKLFPMAYVVTPNLYEASILTGMEVTDLSTMRTAAEKIHAMGPQHVIVKGGHLPNRAMDLLFDGNKFNVFDAPKVQSTNLHGIGDCFSAALAGLLARGLKLDESIDKSKKYLAKAAVHPFKIGKGRGPLNLTTPF